MKWHSFSFLYVLLALALPAYALDYSWAPEECEFTMNLPGEPDIIERCDPDNPDLCQRITTYTKVYDLHASINFNVTCYPVQEDMYERYGVEVMEATLAAIAENKQLDDYQTGAVKYEQAKHAIIIGNGRTGNSDKIYVGQLWIGHQSIMSIESALVGTPEDEVQNQFTAILHSVRHRDWTDGFPDPITIPEPIPDAVDRAAEQP